MLQRILNLVTGWLPGVRPSDFFTRAAIIPTEAPSEMFLHEAVARRKSCLTLGILSASNGDELLDLKMPKKATLSSVSGPGTRKSSIQLTSLISRAIGKSAGSLTRELSRQTEVQIVAGWRVLLVTADQTRATTVIRDSSSVGAQYGCLVGEAAPIQVALNPSTGAALADNI